MELSTNCKHNAKVYLDGAVFVFPKLPLLMALYRTLGNFMTDSLAMCAHIVVLCFGKMIMQLRLIRV